MRLPRQDLSWTTFLDVFDKDFWIALASGIVCCSIAMYFLFRAVILEPNIDLNTSFALVTLSFLALNIPKYPNRAPGRIFVLNILLLGAITYWSYNAILVSLVTVEKFTFPIQSLEDLAANPAYKLYMEGGTAYVDYFKLATEESNKVAKQIWDQVSCT